MLENDEKIKSPRENARLKREAEALRANLIRRKKQSRAREDQEVDAIQKKDAE